MYMLIETTKLNDIDPQAWLPGVLIRGFSDLLPGIRAGRLESLRLPDRNLAW
jgi:hypothetical protein